MSELFMVMCLTIAIAILIIWLLIRHNRSLNRKLSALKQQNQNLQTIIERAHDRHLIERNTATLSDVDLDSVMSDAGWLRD